MLSLTCNPERTPGVQLATAAGVRPEWIACAGGRESVLAHDRFYLRERRRWKRLLAKVHPDTFYNSPEAVASPARRYDHCVCGRVKRRLSHRCQQCEVRARPGTEFKRCWRLFTAWQVEAREWYTERSLAPPTWGEA